MHSQKHKTVFLVSIAVLVLSIVLSTWGIPKIVNLQVKKNIQLEESSQTFGKFLKLPMPLVFKIYVFNVTNADEVNAGAKPKLNEIGPYVYKQYRERTILGYGPNDTVKYNLKKTFYFDEKASGFLTQNDDVVVINFSYMAAILTIQGMMPDAVGLINPALEELFTNLTDPFLRVKVKDLFFDGIFLNCKGEHSALGLVCGQIKADAPPTMRPAEDGSGFYFSMFSHLNRSETGPYEMVRGTKNIYDLGNIVSYKGKTSMDQWHDQYCGMINGSDSTIFAPINEKNVPLKQYSFEPDICRSLYVSYVERATLFSMNVFYYEMDNQALAAKSANPNNKCFCRRNWSANHDGCLIMGVLNLMPCQGAPAIASLPHFYLASEELLQYFESGVQPDQEKHKTYVYVEQVTGVPVKGAKRLQFNIELRQMKGVPQLENVRTGLFPMLWIEEGAEIPEEVQKELLQSYKLLSYVEIVRWTILAIAVIVAILAGALLARSTRMPIWPRNQVTMVLNPTNGNK